MNEKLTEIVRTSLWSQEQVKHHIDKVYAAADQASNRDDYIRETMEQMWTTAMSHFAREKCYRSLTGGLQSPMADEIRTVMFSVGKENGYENHGS